MDTMDGHQIVARMDPRLKLLSYSFQTLLHRCPRKYQLTRLRALEDERDPLANINQNITFAFGHIVGSGIQDIMIGVSEERTIFNMYCAWHADFLDRNDKQQKSFAHAVFAVQRFIAMRESGFLDEYELVWYEGKPAIELSFLIVMPDGFKMRGSIDAILRHKETGVIVVLECKTDGDLEVQYGKYKNSSQAIGYSVILDILFPDLSGYEVLYLVYLCKKKEYEILQFPKSHTQKALFIQELLLDIEMLKMYETVGVYPMYGHSCRDFFRDCEFLQTCTLSTKYLTNKQTEADNTETNSTYKGEYTITISLLDLLQGQLSKNAINQEAREIAEEEDIKSREHLVNFDPIKDELL